MKLITDPTTKLRKSQPELTDVMIINSLAARFGIYTTRDTLLIDQFHKNNKTSQFAMAAFVSHKGELHELAVDSTRIPLAVLVRKTEVGLGYRTEKVYFYQHGVTGFTYDEDGEHTSEVWMTTI
jgi:hypothetical protein